VRAGVAWAWGVGGTAGGDRMLRWKAEMLETRRICHTKCMHRVSPRGLGLAVNKTSTTLARQL
jgi:hypothetical protein